MSFQNTLGGEIISIVNVDTIKEEVVVFFRNNLTDPSSRDTIGSDVYTAGGASGNFTLSHKDVKNITSLTVSGIAQTAYLDYTPDYKNNDPTLFPTATMASAPVSGVQVIVNYKYGTGWIFPDYPRKDLTLSSYPRVGIDIISKRTEPLGIGGTAILSDYLMSMVAYADKASVVDSILAEAGSVLFLNMKNFQNFKFIYPVSLTALMKDPNREEKIVQRTQDFTILRKPELR